MGFSIIITNQCSALLFLHIDIGPELTMDVDIDGSVPGAGDLSTRIASAETPVLHSHMSHYSPGGRVAHWRDLMPGSRAEIERDREWTLTVRQVVRFGTVERVIRVDRELLLQITSPEPLSWVLEEVGIEAQEDFEQPRQQQQSIETDEQQQPNGITRPNIEIIEESSDGQPKQIQFDETHERSINVEITEIIFNKFPLTWEIPDEIVQKIYADLNQSSIRTRYSSAVAMSKNLQQPNNKTEYDYFVNNPQIIQITQNPNELDVNNKVPLLFKYFLFLTCGNSLPLSFNYSNEFGLQNSQQILASDLTSQLSFPKRTPEVGPLLCLDIFHFRLGQMTNWESKLLYQLIFEQKINKIGSTHGCIIPLIEFGSMTLADSAAFLRMKIAQFSICLTRKEILIGFYVRELLKIIAKVRIKLIGELIEYTSKENARVNESCFQLIWNLMQYCLDRLKDLREFQISFFDNFPNAGLKELNLQNYNFDELAIISSLCHNLLEKNISLNKPLSLQEAIKKYLISLESKPTFAHSSIVAASGISAPAPRLRANFSNDSHLSLAMSITQFLRVPVHLYLPFSSSFLIPSLSNTPVGSRSSSID